MRLSRTSALALGLLLGLSGSAEDAHAETLDETCWSPWAFVSVDHPTSPAREVQVDLSTFGPFGGTDRFSYSVDAALAPLTATELAVQPDWVIGMRLVLSEVGPDRLLDNRFGVLEAVGILQTVTNRLDPNVWNPQGIDGLRPWPGCSERGSFRTCASPRQYYGLRTRSALDPGTTMRDEARLVEAVDVAMTAWWLHRSGHVPDLTGGATSFVHRCGGAAYGALTTSCDGDKRVPDVPGAQASTGPIAFKGPGRFLSRRGRYEIIDTVTIDYDAQPTPLTSADVAAVIGGDDATTARGEG